MNIKLYNILCVLFIGFLLFFIFTPCSYAQTPAPTELTPTQEPIGQIIKLDFRIPGIGSEGANLKPLHPTRNILLKFYSPDVNSEDRSVKPIAVIPTNASYDDDPASSTYGRFINTNIDLADRVPVGKYQISFKVDNSLPTLVKEKENSVGGTNFEIRGDFSQPILIGDQNIVTGDIYPSPGGDNIMDIKDYNALTGCFGLKTDSSTCLDKNSPDINDDGTVDGTDYNLMLKSFRVLLSRGLPVPSILFPNQISPTKKLSKETFPTKSTDEQKKSQNTTGNGTTKKLFSPILLVVLVVFIIILIIGTVVFLRKRKRSSTFDQKLEEKQNSQTSTAVEGSVDKPEIVEKEFFVKKQTVDENGTTVLTLTDDNGPMLGYYKGDITDGYLKVKGTLKKEGNKVYIEVSEITPANQ